MLQPSFHMNDVTGTKDAPQFLQRSSTVLRNVKSQAVIDPMSRRPLHPGYVDAAFAIDHSGGPRDVGCVYD